MKLHILTIILFLKICYANCQIVSFDSVLPCGIDINVKFRIESSRENDNIVKKKIIAAEKRYDDGIPCVYYRDLKHVLPRAMIYNNSNKAFSFSHLYEKYHGILVLEFYQKSKNKLLPIKLRDYDGDVIYDIFIESKSADSNAIIFIDPVLPISDTGLYLLRSYYRQKCNSKISKKYTNDICFRIVK